MPPKGTKQVVPTVVIEIADADAGLPAGAGKAGFGGNVGEGSVAVVVIELGGRRLAWRPGRVQAGSIGEINVNPAVLIVIEERDTTSLRLNDVTLAVDATPDIRCW